MPAFSATCSVRSKSDSEMIRSTLQTILSISLELTRFGEPIEFTTPNKWQQNAIPIFLLFQIRVT